VHSLYIAVQLARQPTYGGRPYRLQPLNQFTSLRREDAKQGGGGLELQQIASSVPTPDLEIPLWQSGRPRFFGRYNDCEPRLDARDQTKVPITM
jgi:hypothetical protein